MSQLKGVIGQLQRRHVPRTAVLYLGAGWVVLEFVGFVVDNYAVSRSLLDVSLLLLIVGFLIALIVSWYHGAGGRQPITRVEGFMVGGLLLVALVGSGVLATRARPEGRTLTLAPLGMEGADLGEGSLAVLPLANRSGADSLDWLGPGLADMLTTNLAQFSRLRVVSAQRLLDLMRQAGRAETEEIPEDLALEIAARSGARTLVRGSFMTVGDEVRLDVQLIDLVDGTVTAAERSRGSDVFLLVDDVSAKLSSQLLGSVFTPTELTPVTRLVTGNLEAYRAYQEGLLPERRFLTDEAIALYRRAVALDSTFAIAWLRLGIAANMGQEALRAFQNADRFKENAPERDRYLIEAMFAGAFEADAERADSLLRELIRRYPEEKDARYQLGVFYEAQGRAEDGRRVIEEAVALDPYFGPGINHLAYMAGRRGDTVAADTLSLRYLNLEPGQPNPYDSRGEILEMIGRPEDARKAFQEAIRVDPGFIPAYQHLVRSYLRVDDPEGARTALRPFMNARDPEASVNVRRLEGDTYVAEGRYADAIAAYRAAADRAAHLSRADLRLPMLLEAAEMALYTGSFDESEELFREADTIDPMNGGVFLGLLTVNGEQGRIEAMQSVGDSADSLFAAAPALVQRQVDLLVMIADAMIARYRGDMGAAADLFDEIRITFNAPRPALLGGVGPEIIALLATGRAQEALSLAENLEKLASAGNELDPFQRQAGLYLKGRAHEALNEPDSAVAAYERLVALAGEGLRDLLYLNDTPERLAALRSRVR